MNNVIDFASIKQNQQTVIEFDVADYVEDQVIMILEDLEDIFGVDVDSDDEVMNDLRLVFLHLTAAVCRINNVDHPMQKIADDFISESLDSVFSDFSEKSVVGPDLEQQSEE